NTTKIREINNIGPQFEDPIVSNVIIILEKESVLEKREENYIKVKNSNQEPYEIPQKRIKEWDYNFLIHLNNEDHYIINYLINNFPKLKDLIVDRNFKINVSRGIELTKKGKIIYCVECKKYFPIPKKVLNCPECKNPLKVEHIEKIIYDSIPNENKDNYKLFINSINRYQVRDYKFIRIDKKGINYKDLDIYKDRVIIRQLNQNNLICATYDSNLSLTSQSFYNLRIHESPIKEFNNLYLLGIVNSKLMSYYFIKLFGSYKKLFPRILIEKVKEFPIKVPENDREKEIASDIIRKVELLLKLNGSDDRRSNSLQNEIDNLVFGLYKIPDSYQTFILESIKKV
ncbi:MAG: TaqI-like C-terminal specificity domain-containing protein, partial [Candidatus Hermodarchaeota archaeon]